MSLNLTRYRIVWVFSHPTLMFHWCLVCWIMDSARAEAGGSRQGERREDVIINDILSDGKLPERNRGSSFSINWDLASLPMLLFCDGRFLYNALFSDSLQPYFPSIVENVTVSYGRKAVLKCEVENLRNYKVSLWFVETDHVTWILASDWSIAACRGCWLVD